MNKRITLDKTKDKIRQVVCNKCDNRTNHNVCSSVEFYWDTEDIQGIDNYEIVRCSGCDGISFRISSSNSEDCDYGINGEIIHPESEEIYPNRIMGRTTLAEMYFLPEKVRSIYEETHVALCTKLRILAGVGIRALIESVCLEEKAEGKNLEKRIEDLVKKGVLTKTNAEILHKTRFLGNRAAHEVKAASDAELDVAFDILENLLETIYIIPKKAEKLK